MKEEGWSHILRCREIKLEDEFLYKKFTGIGSEMGIGNKKTVLHLKKYKEKWESLSRKHNETDNE
jgi:hypothetical protein